MNKANFSDRYSILLLLPVALSNTNSISDELAEIKSVWQRASFFFLVLKLSCRTLGGKKAWQVGKGVP